MATAAAAPSLLDAKMSRSPGRIGMLVFGVALVIGLIYVGVHLMALMIALGFEAAVVAVAPWW